MWITVKARYLNENEPDYESLGIDRPSKNPFKYKNLDVNTDNLAFIEDYEGWCLIASDDLNHGYITNIKFENRCIFKGEMSEDELNEILKN